MPEPTRRQLGAWYTPPELVDRVVDAVVTADFVDRANGRPLRVVDPACGDGRFLAAVGRRIADYGGTVHLVGVDVDAAAIAAIEARSAKIAVINDDALTHDWQHQAPFDLVIGNPPFLSQMAADTTRGGSSRLGGGPYADAAVEFLALASELVDADGGRVAFVLPQSLLSARDAGPIRRRIDDRAAMVWSWWSGQREFDAQVLTCAVAFEFHSSALRGQANSDRATSSWSHVVTSRRNVPAVPDSFAMHGDGVLGDRVRLNANFRDEYYGMVPAVGDHDDGPRLITSGLIDPGVCLWGHRPIRFAKRPFQRPRIDVDSLDGKMPKWAADRLVPKVLIANQTKIIEAIADPDGTMLPGVPVVAGYPIAGDEDPADRAWEAAAVLNTPVASAWAWSRMAGTGLSADAIRLGPVMLAELPWPAGDLSVAVAALCEGDVRSSAREVHRAFRIVDDDELVAWWEGALARIEARR